MLITCLLEGHTVFKLNYDKYSVGYGSGYGVGYGGSGEGSGFGGGFGYGEGYGEGDGSWRGVVGDGYGYGNGREFGGGWGINCHRGIVSVGEKIQNIYVVEEVRSNDSPSNT